MFSFLKKIFKASPNNDLQDLNLTDEDKKVLKTIDSKIVIGVIVQVRPHNDPKVTKVRVTQCALGGDGETEQILCGGTNIEVGQYVPVATIGAKLSEDFEIGERDIRGETSRGMICARSELGLSPAGEQSGEIWVLPHSVADKLGQPVKDLV